MVTRITTPPPGQESTYTGTVTLVGWSAARARFRRGPDGDAATILLHTGGRPPELPPVPGEDAFPAHTPLCTAILVRGTTARWCRDHLRSGMLLLVEARLHPLGTAGQGISLTVFEAIRMRLLQASCPPPRPPHDTAHGTPHCWLCQAGDALPPPLLCPTETSSRIH